MESQNESQIESSLSRIFSIEQKNEYDENFWWYFRCDNNNLQKPPKELIQKLIRELSDNYELANFSPAGKYILDAGCGFGLSAFITRLLGAQEVYGIDHSASMIETFRKYLVLFPTIEGIYPKCGNVIDTDYQKNYFDFVLSNEAISHYYDIPSFIREAHRVLKPNGLLFISDANNGANPYISWRTKILWQRFENGPSGRVFFSKVDEPYIEARKRQIREQFPSITENVIQVLASNTFGYTSIQIQEACNDYRLNHNLPKSKFCFGVTPIDPTTDQAQERLIYPLKLKKQLEQAGFEVKIYAHLGGARGNRYVRMANSFVEKLSPITLPVGRCIKVVARKIDD